MSAVGQGFISVDKALEDEGFRRWIAAKSLEPLPEEPDEASAKLAEFADAIVERIRPYCRQVPLPENIPRSHGFLSEALHDDS